MHREEPNESETAAFRAEVLLAGLVLILMPLTVVGAVLAWDPALLPGPVLTLAVVVVASQAVTALVVHRRSP